ncbi:hypothetical protein KAR91_32330, partial [Candidatus Pacearchaeota archaeon]|nr:hypothetical protein [Candidatus Pacearchaeota archaeon]
MAKKKKPVALYHRRLETLRKANELSYRLAVRKWWLIQNKQIRKDLNQMIKKDVTADLTDWEFIEQEGERILSPVTLKIVQSGEEAAYATMNVKGSFSLVNVASVKAAKEFTAELVREVTEATKSGIRHAISEGIAEGKSMDKIARELKPMVGLTENQTRSVLNFRTDLEEKGKLSAAKIDKRTARFSEKVRTRRTKTIARTESGRAQNMGYVQGLKDVGVEEVEFSAYFDADEECLD